MGLKVALEQFQKDFAAYEFNRRSMERRKKQGEIDRKREAMLQREDSRWQQEEKRRVKTEQRIEESISNQRQGRKRTANSHGYSPHNPVSPTTPSLSSTTTTPKGNDSNAWTKTTRFAG